MDRRRFLATVGTGGAILSAGCLGSRLDGLTTYAATPATVAEDVLAETGYEHEETDERLEEERVAGQTVELTTYLTRYRRSVQLPGIGEVDAAGFGVLATPSVTVVGREFNPIEDMSDRELAGELQEEFGEVTIEDRVDDRTVEPTGGQTTLTTFDGIASVEGLDEVAVHVDVGRFASGSDHLVVAGVYPEALSSEADRVATLVEGVEHEG